MLGRVQVFGPAYLDRILRVDSPLRGSDSPSIDQSVGGRAGFGQGDALRLVGPDGSTLVVDLPADWPGPRGEITLDRPVGFESGKPRRVRADSWADDLGGMGAGFAAATGGELVAALGPAEDPTSLAVERRLADQGIAARIVRTSTPADWTLLISSGPHGDKLAVGFRGCHEAIATANLAPQLAIPCDVRIVAGLPNRLAAAVLKAPGAGLRVFAPAMRNVLDRDFPVLDFIGPVDVLCCNLTEWEALADREEVAARLSILVVTEGPAGSSARFTDPQGSSRSVRVPAFPRPRPPRDTNRAGESFAAFFLATLLERGWRPESCTAEVETVRAALVRASAASALTIDLTGFGFPTTAEVDEAMRRGVVDGPLIDG